MQYNLFKNYKPAGTILILLIGLGLLFGYLRVTSSSDTSTELPSDLASVAAFKQVTEILDLAQDGDQSNELNRHLDLEIVEYRILEQRFETHFDVLITAQASAGLRGSNICLTLQLDVEENTLAKINELDLDTCDF